MDEKLAFDDYNDFKLVVANIEETFQENSIIMLNMPMTMQMLCVLITSLEHLKG